jgi:hypothetical protein
MDRLVHEAVATLEKFLRNGSVPDRAEVVAHATLAGFVKHWPDHPLANAVREGGLIEKTSRIRDQEPGRWLKQRRIALARLARASA